MNAIRLISIAGGLGATSALLFTALGGLEFLSPEVFAGDAPNVAAVRSDASVIARSAALGGAEVAGNPERPTELLSIWRAGPRAGALIRCADGQARQVRLHENLGDTTLIEVGDGQVVFETARGSRIVLKVDR